MQLRNCLKEGHTVMVHGCLRKQDIKLFLNTDRRALTSDKEIPGSHRGGLLEINEGGNTRGWCQIYSRGSIVCGLIVCSCGSIVCGTIQI